MTGEELLQAVGAYLVTITGLPAARVLAAGSDPVRGTSAYLTVQVVTDEGVGLPEVVEGDDDGDWVAQTRELVNARVSVNGYGAAARAYLEAARARWREPVGAGKTLRDAGVKPYRATTLRNLAAMRDTGTEPRWQFDLLVYVSREHAVSAAVDTTAHVVVDVDVTREAGVSLADAQATVDEPE
jgi:hypothetical protein